MRHEKYISLVDIYIYIYIYILYYTLANLQASRNIKLSLGMHSPSRTWKRGGEGRGWVGRVRGRSGVQRHLTSLPRIFSFFFLSFFFFPSFSFPPSPSPFQKKAGRVSKQGERITQDGSMKREICVSHMACRCCKRFSTDAGMTGGWQGWDGGWMEMVGWFGGLGHLTC